MLSIVVALPDFFSPPHDAMITVTTVAAKRIVSFFMNVCGFSFFIVSKRIVSFPSPILAV